MSSLKSVLFLMVTVVVAIVTMMYVTGCSDNENVANGPLQSQENVLLTKENPAVKAVMEVQERHTPELMSNANVVATATGLNEAGQLAIIVCTKEDPTSIKGRGVDAALPTELEGIPVVVKVTGVIKAMKTSGVSHKAKQTPPIQLGTSGGWRYDLANGYCCGGTLGALIQKGGVQYILSNYHVFWADIVPGGNNRVATAGDPVIQPGLIDVGCNANNAQNVATLSGSGSLPGANVDAGYAQVISGMVRTDGAILEIGTISSSIVGASLNQAVKKSGRTTGLTRSTVNGLNATVNITYDNECAGGTAFTKTFTGQIFIANNGSKFLNSGDSGSLMVEDVTTNPRAVGLLYAGSSTVAVANPIGDVLAWAGATMVGQ
jgi:hypothetical protein